MTLKDIALRVAVYLVLVILLGLLVGGEGKRD